MSSPTIRANNVWDVNGGDDFLQLKTQAGSSLGGIDSTGAGFGNLAGGGVCGADTQIQFNDAGACGVDFHLGWVTSTGSVFFVGGPSAQHTISAGQNQFDVNGPGSSNSIVVNAAETGASLAFAAVQDATMDATVGTARLRSAFGNVNVSAPLGIINLGTNATVTEDGALAVIQIQALGSTTSTSVLAAGSNNFGASGSGASNAVVMSGPEAGAQAVIFADQNVSLNSVNASVRLTDSLSNPIVSVTHDAKIGFFAATPIVKPTVTGVKGGNTALASLLTKLVALGLIIDSTT